MASSLSARERESSARDHESEQLLLAHSICIYVLREPTCACSARDHESEQLLLAHSICIYVLREPTCACTRVHVHTCVPARERCERTAAARSVGVSVLARRPSPMSLTRRSMAPAAVIASRFSALLSARMAGVRRCGLHLQVCHVHMYVHMYVQVYAYACVWHLRGWRVRRWPSSERRRCEGQVRRRAA